MRTFYIASSLFILLILWLVNKPIESNQQIAREFQDAEISYREKSFDYSMDNLKSGQFHDWAVAGVNGRIAAGDLYTSKQKISCRNYVEVSRTHEAQKVESGIACKRADKSGWCRVKIGDPESCALENTESALAKRLRFSIMQGNQTIDNATGKHVNINSNNLTPSAPTNITIPSLGPLPEIKSPDFDPADLRPPMPWDSNQK